MKKMILLASLLLSALTLSAATKKADCNVSDAAVITTSSFAQTRIGVPATVHFVQGEDFGYSVTTEDEDDLSRLSVAVKDMCLTFTLKGALSYGDPITYDITVYAPATPEVKLAANYEVTSLSLSDEPDLAMTE